MESKEKRTYPSGTRIEIDEQGRRIIILPPIGRRSLGIDSRSVGGWTSRDQNRAQKKLDKLKIAIQC